MLSFVFAIIVFLVLTIYILLSVAFFTILERKVIAYIQRRQGPTKVAPFGQLQAIADAIKLLVKNIITPQNALTLIYTAAPILTFTFSLVSWSVIPLTEEICILNTPFSLLYLLAFSSLAIYGIVMGGWASNSSYTFLGAIRAVAQMISYEVSLGIIFMSIGATAGTLNLTSIVSAQSEVWYIFPHFPLFILFFISALAETSRIPFDFAEAESELVSGYNTEYGGVLFVLYFLAEYSSMLLMAVLTVLLFFGGWLDPTNLIGDGVIVLTLKSLVILFFYIAIRAVYPRARYNQLMTFCWKHNLPLSAAWFVLTVTLLLVFDGSPAIGGVGIGFNNYLKAF